eukprot:1746308-Pleurochrysis_carterae.AAC.1
MSPKRVMPSIAKMKTRRQSRPTKLSILETEMASAWSSVRSPPHERISLSTRSSRKARSTEVLRPCGSGSSESKMSSSETSTMRPSNLLNGSRQ